MKETNVKWFNTGATASEPKRAFKWLVDVDGIEQWVLKSVDKPKFDISETEHKYLSHTFYYPGKVSWQAVTMTMVDAVDPNTASKIIQKVANGGYDPSVVDTNATPFICKRNLVFNTFKITQFDCSTASDERVEEWTLHNAWIKSVQFGKLDYATEDMVDIELSIRYDWATYTANKGGVVPGANYWAPGGNTPKASLV
jgi:outer membrane receptor protein involved in Fe transport